MSLHGKFLQSYQRIFLAMKKIEKQYKAIYDLDGEVMCDHKIGYEAYLDLSSNIECTIKPWLLSPKEIEEYDELIIAVVNELRLWGRNLYEVQLQIEEIIYEGWRAAVDACSEYMHTNQGRTFFACGYASISIPVRRVSFIGLLMKDSQSVGVYKFTDGQLKIDFEGIFSKYSDINLSQAYEIREISYRAALGIINSKLRLNGSFEAWIS
jgi:hypothetical protein